MISLYMRSFLYHLKQVMEIVELSKCMFCKYYINILWINNLWYLPAVLLVFIGVNRGEGVTESFLIVMECRKSNAIVQLITYANIIY